MNMLNAAEIFEACERTVGITCCVCGGNGGMNDATERKDSRRRFILEGLIFILLLLVCMFGFESFEFVKFEAIEAA